MRASQIAGWLCLLGFGVAGCGEDAGARRAPAALPPSGRAYLALDARERDAVAATCRDRAAGAARGLAARELHAIDRSALREQLDGAYSVIAARRRPVADVCREAIPFVTPGLQISFDRATDLRDGTFKFQTSSDKPLTMSGRVVPSPARGRVVARRELAPSELRSARLAPDGRFTLPAARLHKVADNTFSVTIHAPPHAPHRVLFTAICLDCLAGGPPPGR